jgi:anaerobic selenocysteine-containing dehydrogenase
MPDQVRIGRALKSLDLLVSLDVEMSNTARMADYIIPDKQGLETPACTQFTESMKYYGVWTQGFEYPYAMYAPAVVDPPAGSDVLEIWEFYYELAKRLGMQLTYWANPAGMGEHWEKQPVGFELDMGTRPSTEDMFEKMCVGSRVPLEDVKKFPHGKLFDDLDNIVLPRDPGCTARLELGDPHMMTELGQVFAERGGRTSPDADYPLLMTARRRNEVLNSIGRMNTRLVGRQPYNPAYLSPADLERFAINSGDVIRIRSRHGEIVGVAEVEATLRPGTLSMAHCFGPNPDEEADPLGQGACTSRLMDSNAE